METESAIEKALAVLRERDPSNKSMEEADRALRNAGLPDIDPFGIRLGQLCRRPPPKGEAGGDAEDASIMPLKCAPEPSSFDAKVRPKELSAIAEFIGYEGGGTKLPVLEWHALCIADELRR